MALPFFPAGHGQPAGARLDGARITLIDPRRDASLPAGPEPGGHGAEAGGLRRLQSPRDWLPGRGRPGAGKRGRRRSGSEDGLDRRRHDRLPMTGSSWRRGWCLTTTRSRASRSTSWARTGSARFMRGPSMPPAPGPPRSLHRTGGTAIFSRPATEMKCAGAPLKHAFLIDDIARRRQRRQGQDGLYGAAGALFGVPIVAEKVRMLFQDRGIGTMMKRTLTAIDPGREARDLFHRKRTEEIDYDYLHVIPPQRAPEFIRQSGLAWADRWTDQGWVEVDPGHSAPPPPPRDLRAGRRGRGAQGQDRGEREMAGAGGRGSPRRRPRRHEGTETYDGYTSCPLITRIGRAMLVEFDYHDNLVPSFPGVIARSRSCGSAG
jgi:sulfide:quinone oxidoreductase